ncbi:MAG: TatD family deoxyribonuclease [Clostridiales bacterium]|nr:TatD family deoxyribonuclease [Clostridiales bacterium]
MRVFDTHCHLDDERFNEDRESAYQRMMDSGVKRCICVGSDLSSSRRCLELAEKYDGVYAAVGVHPHEAKDAPGDYIKSLTDMLRHPKAVALGEIGLDYYYDLSPRDVQKQVMAEQMELAMQLDKPVIFHIRDAHGDMVDFFRKSKRLPSGVIHCFSGSAETAKEYVKMGFFISFAGPLTFKKAPNLWEAACEVPLERLLVETDSPYLSPEPYRGRRNEPAHVVWVMKKLAALRDMTEEEMARLTWDNACRMYRI